MSGRELKRIRIIPAVFTFYLLFSFCGAPYLSAQSAKKEEPRRISVMKEVTGEVTWVKKDNISVVFQRNDEMGYESEILLPYASDMKMMHKRSVSQLARGDIVRIQYEEVTEEAPDGAKILISRKAKMITFLRAADKKPEPVKIEGKRLSSE